MKQVKKGNVVREVRDNQVERHLQNGWTLDSGKIVLKPVKPKQNAEDAPAVEDVSSEQGETNETQGEIL